MRDLTPDELLPADELAPLMGVQSLALPSELERLFVGVFANIQFSLAFAAVKFVLGITTIAAARAFRRGASWGRRWLELMSAAGVAAFAAIGVFFVFSGIVMIRAWPQVPVFYLLFPILGGALIAGLIAIPLVRILRTLRSESVTRMTQS